MSGNFVMADGKVAVRVKLRCVATGEVREYGDRFAMQGDAWMWSDGNYSCDCNRALCFRRTAGEPEDWDTLDCGSGAYEVRIATEDGDLVLHEDGEWP